MVDSQHSGSGFEPTIGRFAAATELYHVGTVISRQRKSGIVDGVLLSDRPDFFPLGFRFRDRPCEMLRGRGFEFPRKFRVKQDPALQRSLER